MLEFGRMVVLEFGREDITENFVRSFCLRLVRSGCAPPNAGLDGFEQCWTGLGFENDLDRDLKMGLPTGSKVLFSFQDYDLKIGLRTGSISLSPRTAAASHRRSRKICRAARMTLHNSGLWDNSNSRISPSRLHSIYQFIGVHSFYLPAHWQQVSHHGFIIISFYIGLRLENHRYGYCGMIGQALHNLALYSLAWDLAVKGRGMIDGAK